MFLDIYEKIQQFLSSVKRDAHKRKTVPFFCLTVYNKPIADCRLRFQCCPLASNFEQTHVASRLLRVAVTCARDVTSSTRPEVDNVVACCQTTTEPHEKLRGVWICRFWETTRERTDRHTERQTRATWRYAAKRRQDETPRRNICNIVEQSRRISSSVSHEGFFVQQHGRNRCC